MKSIFLTSLLFLSTLFASDVEFVTSLETAKEKALKEEKLIMVFFTQESCSVCEYMKETTFENEELVEYIETNFIPLELDINQPHSLPQLKVYGTPTTYIFTANAQQVGRQIIGGATARAFLKVLKEYKAKANK